jgi:hypothetical protein
MTDTNAMKRFRQGCRNMLTAFDNSPAHKAVLNSALAQFKLKSLSQVTDDRLFDVCDVARGMLGWPSGMMFASSAYGVSPNDLGKQSDTVRDKIASMAREFYARAADDVELNPHVPANGKPVRFGLAHESNADFLEKLNRRMLGQ